MKDIYNERKALKIKVATYTQKSDNRLLLDIIRHKAQIDQMQKSILGSHDTLNETRLFFVSFIPKTCLAHAIGYYLSQMTL